MKTFDHILLFKTNISCDADKALLGAVLNNHADIQSWTVDTEDEDCVLRVISHTLSHQQIIDLITNYGYSCCELT